MLTISYSKIRVQERKQYIQGSQGRESQKSTPVKILNGVNGFFNILNIVSEPMNYVTDIVGISTNLEMDIVNDRINSEEITPDERIITILK